MRLATVAQTFLRPLRAQLLITPAVSAGASTQRPQPLSPWQTGYAIHTSAASHSIFGGRFFRKLGKKRHHPTDQPQDPLKMTLFNQWMLPEDLRLPRPGDPLKRIGAGLVDAAIAGIGGAAAFGFAKYVVGDAVLASELGAAVTLVLLTVRDGLGDGGNRSLGKRVFGLELAYRDGTLVTSLHATLRNAYFLVVPVLGMHPLLQLGGSLFFVFDIASVLLTQDARKSGDYALGTRVVDERPGRAERQLDLVQTAEVRLLRKEIDELAPGLLDKSTDPRDEWYESQLSASNATLTNAELMKLPEGRKLSAKELHHATLSAGRATIGPPPVGAFDHRDSDGAPSLPPSPLQAALLRTAQQAQCTSPSLGAAPASTASLRTQPPPRKPKTDS